MIKTLAKLNISELVHLIRGERVMLDADLARLYGVSTKALNQAVSRNQERFPDDFGFKLTAEEVSGLRSQIVTSNGGRGGRRYLPYVFTEQGVAMLSSVLRSKSAIAINIEIMRTFVRLRQMVLPHPDLVRKFALLERKVVQHDQQLKWIFDALRTLMEPPPRPRKRIGFQKGEP